MMFLLNSTITKAFQSSCALRNAVSQLSMSKGNSPPSRTVCRNFTTFIEKKISCLPFGLAQFRIGIANSRTCLHALLFPINSVRKKHKRKKEKKGELMDSFFKITKTEKCNSLEEQCEKKDDEKKSFLVTKRINLIIYVIIFHPSLNERGAVTFLC